MLGENSEILVIFRTQSSNIANFGEKISCLKHWLFFSIFLRGEVAGGDIPKITNKTKIQQTIQVQIHRMDTQTIQLTIL